MKVPQVRQPGRRLRADLAAIALIGAAGACTSRNVEDDRVVEGRLEACTLYCDVLFSPCDLGNGPIPDKETCMHECSTVAGSWTPLWVYDPESDTDLCGDEKAAVLTCMAENACFYTAERAGGDPGGLPSDDKPCAQQVSDHGDCRDAHRSGGAE
jgi:hypothetical protein